MSNQMNRSLLQIDNVTKIYGETIAVNNVSVKLEEKGFVFVNGISGSGKTTLMNIISGLDSPTFGNVYYDEKNITKMKSADIDEYRNSEIGIVFQNFNLIDEISVEENLRLPLMIQTIEEEQKKILIDETLDFVGLRGYGKRKGYELSAGQKQRVAIARAIIKRPRVIFADEATGNLDAKNTEQILRLFDAISKRCLVVLISHNNNSAKKYADRIITLDEGEICEDIDNRQMKGLYLEPYKISIEGDNYKQQMDLENFDIKSVIKDFIDKSGKHFDTYSFNTKITLENRRDKEKYNWSEFKNIKTRSMPLVEIFKCMLRMMKANKIKLFLVSCLFVFISMLFFLIVSISTNDYYMSLSRYVNNQDSTLHDVKKIIYSNGGENDTQKGEKIYTQLEEICGVNNLIECMGEMLFERKDGMFYATAFKNNSYFNGVDIVGEWPTEINEIAISKCMSREGDIEIGDYVLNEEIKYKVVGIYNSKSIIEGNSVVLSDDISSEMLKQTKAINLQACNILKSVDLDEYVSEIANIGKISSVRGEDLIWGRMPGNGSEILVSKNVMEEYGMNLEEGFVTKYRLHNLYDEKYNSQYEQFINMYDYLGKKVEIVGVFNTDNNYEIGDILIQDCLYLDITNFYDKYLSYESLYVDLDDPCENYELIKLMKKQDIYLSDSICAYIYSIQRFLQNMRNVLKLVLIVMLIMLVSVIVSFLSYNVKDYSKTVGIYKSLGVKNMDIAKNFILENIIITIFSVIISNLGLCVVVNFINVQIFNAVEMSNYEVFILNKLSCVLMSMFVIVMSVIATIVPVTNMVKKESVTLINREEC